MNRTKYIPDAYYLSILSHLQSLHPDDNEITLKFADQTSMEVFKLAAMNALFAEKQQFSPEKKPTKAKSLKRRLESVEDDLFGHKPSKRATILCRNPLFWRYLESTQPLIFDKIDAAKSKLYIRKTCAITHRRELDYDHRAQQHYHEIIENPFLAWLAL